MNNNDDTMFETIDRIQFKVSMTDIGPFAELPLHKTDLKVLTDKSKGAVNFMIEVDGNEPVARIPLIQLHMGKLGYMYDILPPESIRSFVYMSDPDKIMRYIYMKRTDMIMHALESEKLTIKHLERSIELNDRDITNLLVICGCPTTKELKEMVRNNGWSEILGEMR